jgi:hypothetical protein
VSTYNISFDLHSTCPIQQMSLPFVYEKSGLMLQLYIYNTLKAHKSQLKLRNEVFGSIHRNERGNTGLTWAINHRRAPGHEDNSVDNHWS